MVQPALSVTKDEVVGLLALDLWLPTVGDLESGVLYWKDNTEG